MYNPASTLLDFMHVAIEHLIALTTQVEKKLTDDGDRLQNP
jgi:hypothetical protein